MHGVSGNPIAAAHAHTCSMVHLATGSVLGSGASCVAWRPVLGSGSGSGWGSRTRSSPSVSADRAGSCSTDFRTDMDEPKWSMPDVVRVCGSSGVVGGGVPMCGLGVLPRDPSWPAPPSSRCGGRQRACLESVSLTLPLLQACSRSAACLQRVAAQRVSLRLSCTTEGGGAWRRRACGARARARRYVSLY